MAMKKQPKRGNLTKAAGQPSGHSLGYPKPNEHKSTGAKSGQYSHGIFSPPAASGADRFSKTKNKGVLRTSGSGHMLGCKK